MAISKGYASMLDCSCMYKHCNLLINMKGDVFPRERCIVQRIYTYSERANERALHSLEAL